MADPLCRVMDVSGVANPNSGGATDKKAVAKICFDPSTLQVNSAAVVRLTTDEIQKVEADYQARAHRKGPLPNRSAVAYGPEIMTEETIDALRRIVERHPRVISPTPPKSSDKKK